MHQEGIEPPTPSSEDWRSNPLSYWCLTAILYPKAKLTPKEVIKTADMLVSDAAVSGLLVSHRLE